MQIRYGASLYSLFIFTDMIKAKCFSSKQTICHFLKIHVLIVHIQACSTCDQLVCIVDPNEIDS